MKARDAVHLGLMLLALAAAYLLPFELLVLSYAILGPAHYFTEISWLHDRNFYLPNRNLGALLAFAALGAMFIADPYWYGLLVASCFIACALLAGSFTRNQRLVLAAIAVAVLIAAGQIRAPYVIAGVLLTTLIHVSVFTLVFMIVGAHRARSAALYGLVGLYVAVLVFIVAVPPPSTPVIPALATISKTYFADVAPAIGSLFGNPHLTFDSRLVGVLSFAYTYHYLNWFIKADVIKWANVPKKRMIGIALASAASTGLYLYNYKTGFMVLLLLSLIHILLEFPLNSLSLRELGGLVASGFRPSAPSSPAGKLRRKSA